MAGEWRTVTLGEFAPFTYGKGLPEHRRDPSGHVPVFGSNGVVGAHSEALTSGPTVIIGRKGTVGAVHYSAKPCWAIDTTFYVTDPDPNVLRFKYYLLKSLGLEHMNADSAVPGLNREAAHARKVRIPPLPEQRAISHILGTLDDKIELNRRMNETLEAMARALFKSWFVDFLPVRAKQRARTQTGDPVRAKIEGRLPAGRQAAPAWPKPGTWCVYALECDDGSVYIGHTENLERRFEEHTKGKGADWTKRHSPKRIAYWEETRSQSAAIERERKLKTGSGRKWLKLEIARRDITAGLPQPPCLPDTQVADLFPDSFEDSELGEIPKGWRISRLGDEARTLLGGTPSRTEPEYWGGDIPWINSGKANEFRIIQPSEFITKVGLESSATKLLPARTTVIAITGATLGQVSITEIATCGNQSIVGVLGSEKLPSEFIYFWVKENIDRLIASQTGGAQQHINKNNVNELPIICPSAHVVGAYLDLAGPVFDRIKESCFESQNLSGLRDTLLPKLISGELRVQDAQWLTARAVA